VSIGFADWALYKGVLVTTLDVGGSPVVVMNTHLQANYLGKWDLSNEQARIELDQVKFLADLARSQPVDAWVFACGDFNFPRGTPPYDWMAAESGLTDALAADPRPTYRPFPLVSAKWQMSLDYFFYRRPEGDKTPVTADIVPIENSTAGWYFQRFLTDHHALVLNIG
jgi:endonuclease/exonuclease/phosphatase family metal-dependent hydrolase